jgi:hydroxymethylpyrimidine/phosphomethylpyrimidine kinase
LSAAITAWLARGAGVVEACERGRAFIQRAFVRANELAGGTRVAGIEAAAG